MQLKGWLTFSPWTLGLNVQDVSAETASMAAEGAAGASAAANTEANVDRGIGKGEKPPGVNASAPGYTFKFNKGIDKLNMQAKRMEKLHALKGAKAGSRCGRR